MLPCSNSPRKRAPMGLFFCGTAPGAYGPALRTALHSRRGFPLAWQPSLNETLVPGQSVSRMMEQRCGVNVPCVRRRRRWGTPHGRRRKQCSDRCRWRMTRRHPVFARHVNRRHPVSAIQHRRAAAYPGRPACRSSPTAPHEAGPRIGFSTGISHPIMPLS